MLGRILVAGLMLAAQTAIVVAATPAAPFGSDRQRNDQRSERRMAQTQVEAPLVKGTITIIYEKPEKPADTRPPPPPPTVVAKPPPPPPPTVVTQLPPTTETCPPGERYHKDYKRCLPADLVPTAENCPPGETYHKDYKRCLPTALVPTAENCPSGETYHKDYKRCLPTALVPTAENCPSGETYHKDYKRCLPTALVPTVENCPAGETYHKDYKRCLPTPKVAAPVPPTGLNCPEGKVRVGADCVPRAGTPTTTAAPKTCDRGEVMRDGKCVEIEDERPPTETASLPREVQAELSRIGCLSGPVDGIWGSGSRASLKEFYERAGGSTGNLEPTSAALAATRSKDVGFCASRDRPPTQTRDRDDDDDERRCQRGFERDRRGDCVRIVRPEECDRGFERNRRGDCERIRRGPEQPIPPDHGDDEEQKKNQRCDRGFVRRDGRCQRVNCPTNAHQTRGINCECNSGYVQQGEQCVRQSANCPAGSVRRDGRCQHVNCPTNAHHTSGTNCECNSGYVQQGSQCVRRQGDRETSPGRSRGPTPQQKEVTCRAQAANGAWGQASSTNSDRAAGAAIGECSKRSGGQPCRVTCR